MNVAHPAVFAVRFQIALVDSLLTTCRSVWMNPADAAVKAKAWANIDVLLDKRLELMKQRDALLAP